MRQTFVLLKNHNEEILMAEIEVFLVITKKVFFGVRIVRFLRKWENGCGYWVKMVSLFEKRAKINIVSILP
jgi:hypothetical protein